MSYGLLRVRNRRRRASESALLSMGGSRTRRYRFWAGECIPLALSCLAIGACNPTPGGHEGATSFSESAEEESTESGGSTCEGAALTYGNTCYFPVEAPIAGVGHVLQLNQNPGAELVSVFDGVVAVYTWADDGFILAGQAPIPNQFPGLAHVVAGEFDEQPGLDLVVSEPGSWVTLYHVSDAGELEMAHLTTFEGSNPSPRAFAGAVAIGPDAQGRSRIIAHYDDSDGGDSSADRIAVWEFQGSSFVSERVDLAHDGCELGQCSGGDFNADGRNDAVCTVLDACGSGVHAHVLLLAKSDGSVDASEHTFELPNQTLLTGDINRDLRADLVGLNRLRVATPEGLGDLVEDGTFPPSPSLQWSSYVGDFDGDGHLEFLVAEQDRGLVFRDRSVTLDFEEVELAGAEFPPGAYQAALDLNGDGASDIQLGNGTILISEVNP